MQARSSFPHKSQRTLWLSRVGIGWYWLDIWLIWLDFGCNILLDSESSSGTRAFAAKLPTLESLPEQWGCGDATGLRVQSAPSQVLASRSLPSPSFGATSIVIQRRWLNAHPKSPSEVGGATGSEGAREKRSWIFGLRTLST